MTFEPDLKIEPEGAANWDINDPKVLRCATCGNALRIYSPELPEQVEHLMRLNEQLQITIAGLRMPTLVSENERLRAAFGAAPERPYQGSDIYEIRTWFADYQKWKDAALKG